MYTRESDDIRRPATDRGDEVQPIELQSSLAPSSPPTVDQLMGMSAIAWLLDIDGTRLSGSQVTVWTPAGRVVRALGSDDVGSGSGARGAIGCARYNPRRGALELLECQKLAQMIRVTAPANVAASLSFTVTSCTVLDDNQNPCEGGREVTITNWPQQVCSGVVCTCLADGSGGYFVIDADCPPGGGCT